MTTNPSLKHGRYRLTPDQRVPRNRPEAFNTKQRKEIMTQPKYEIGDTLCHKADHGHRLFVVSRLTEECPGGTQCHYHCRVFSEAGMTLTISKYNEVELQPIPPELTMLDMVKQLKSMAVEAGDMELASTIRETEKRMNRK